MQIKEFDIILDIKKYKKIEEFEVVQGDIDTNQLNITLYDGLDIYSLENLDVEIAFAKSDGTTVLQSSQDEESPIIIEGDKIICTLKSNSIAAPGKVLSEVRILEDTRLLTSARFEFYVRKAIVNDDTIESTNEFPILNKLINDTKNIVEAVPAIESKLEEINDTESELNQSILEGNALKGGLDSSIQEGNLLKAGLDNSIVEGNIVKGELDDIIAGTDFEQVLAELNNKADKTELGELAGIGRTTETVKGNADDLVAHKEETNAHGNNGNILYFEDKTRIMKPLEEVFTPIPINSQEEFDTVANNFSNAMPNSTSYKRVIGFNIGIPSIGGYGGTWFLEGYKVTNLYESQKLIGYNGSLMYYRVKFSGTWSEWYQIATNKHMSYISATLQNGWTSEVQYRRNSIGQLELFINATSGTVSNNTIVCELPKIYAPRTNSVIPLYDFTTGDIATSHLAVIDDGTNLMIRVKGTTLVTGRRYRNTIVFP